MHPHRLTVFWVTHVELRVHLQDKDHQYSSFSGSSLHITGNDPEAGRVTVADVRLRETRPPGRSFLESASIAPVRGLWYRVSVAPHSVNAEPLSQSASASSLSHDFFLVQCLTAAVIDEGLLLRSIPEVWNRSESTL